MRYCTGLPKIVATGLLLPAAPCPKNAAIPLDSKARRCPECAKKALVRHNTGYWAERRGERHCPCGALVGVGSRELGGRRNKYCRDCRERPKVGAEKAEPQLQGRAAAEADWDVLRLIQEASHEACATKEEWAERAGRDPDGADTDRQWVRVKARLKRFGFEVEVVEFDAVRETPSGQSQCYKRWGVRIKPPEEG